MVLTTRLLPNPCDFEKLSMARISFLFIPRAELYRILLLWRWNQKYRTDPIYLSKNINDN